MSSIASVMAAHLAPERHTYTYTPEYGYTNCAVKRIGKLIKIEPFKANYIHTMLFFNNKFFKQIVICVLRLYIFFLLLLIELCKCKDFQLTHSDEMFNSSGYVTIFFLFALFVILCGAFNIRTCHQIDFVSFARSPNAIHNLYVNM